MYDDRAGKICVTFEVVNREPTVHPPTVQVAEDLLRLPHCLLEDGAPLEHQLLPLLRLELGKAVSIHRVKRAQRLERGHCPQAAGRAAPAP